MNILGEVKVFCNQKNVTGALLITGKWGCGKSHFIENIFMNDEDVKSHFAIVKLSLFGIATRDQFNLELKKQYIKVRFPKIDKQSEKKIVSSGFNFIKSLAKASTLGELVVSADWSVFVNVEDFNDKKILLIFDDLERCGMDMDILLGVLNEQIETLKHQTILIANEDFMIANDESGEDIYVAMKEKVISRTIKLVPNHTNIICSLIKNYKESCNGYIDFLTSNKYEIEKVFLDSQTSNIRSLKCALQDFERFYQLILQYIDNKDIRSELLYNYLALVFEYKTGNSSRKQTESEDMLWYNLFKDYDVKQKYKNFTSQHGTKAMKEWISEGQWNEKLFLDELNEIIKRTKKREPKEILLDYTDLMFIEDDILEVGFQPLLEDAYQGLINLNDYISIFNMLVSAKYFDVNLPIEINYEKLKKGIDIRISQLNTGKISESTTVISRISDSNLEFLPTVARKLIKHIDEFREEARYTSNRHLVLEALDTNNSKYVDEWMSKYTGPFDDVYSESIVRYFNSLENSSKRFFIEELVDSLNDTRLYSSVYVDISLSGLTNLSEKTKVDNKDRKISTALNQLLYDKIVGIIEKLTKK